MNLLLHIGSHKTASTSIQHFFALNCGVLAACGYFYPRSKDSAYVFNFLASQIAFGKEAQAAEFLRQACIDAKASQCHTVVISAESFYAMTAFFWDIQRKPYNEDYWEKESSLITKTREICGEFDSVKIACYLRPQDEFASSLYNQFVKNTIGIDDTFENCIARIKPVFDYDRHIRLWENSFGRNNVTVKNFSAVKKYITQDFCDSFLSSDCFAKAQKKEFMSNTRLARDVLEYKRIYNRTKPDRPAAFVAARCFRDDISPHFHDEPGYQIFSSHATRGALFDEFTMGNEALSMRYGMGDFSCVAEKEEPTYPGLSTGAEEKICQRFNFLMNKPLNRLEIIARRLAEYITESFPGGRKILAPVRDLHHRIRLQFSGW